MNLQLNKISPYAIPGIRHASQGITIDDIKFVIENHTEFEWEKLISKSRKVEWVTMRHVISHILYHQINKKHRLSLKTIGAHLGGRDHTTVTNSLAVFKRLKESKDEMLMEYYNLFQSYL